MPAGTGVDTVELMWTPMSRVGTRGIRPPAGAVENMRRLGLIRARDLVPSPPSSEGRPLLAVSGSSWGPARVSSSHTWEARMWSAFAGGTDYRSSLFAPQSSCPGSSWRQGSHLPYTSMGLLR